MAVPNTTTFNLQDVTTEVYFDTNAGRNLSDCFTDALVGRFDPAYSGAKNNLLNFRNYNNIVWSQTPVISSLAHVSGTTYSFYLNLEGISSFSSGASTWMYFGVNGVDYFFIGTVGSVSATTYNFTYGGFTSGTTIFFRVLTYDSGNNASPYSNFLRVAIP
jgi:hypothetical protein